MSSCIHPVEYKITVTLPGYGTKEVIMKLSSVDPKEVISDIIKELGGTTTFQMTDEGHNQMMKDLSYLEDDYIKGR